MKRGKEMSEHGRAKEGKVGKCATENNSVKCVRVNVIKQTGNINNSGQVRLVIRLTGPLA